MRGRWLLLSLCVVSALAASAASAIHIPSPPPQTADARAPYNAALGVPEGRGQSTCCGRPSESPEGVQGCDDPTCENFICSIDPFCCEEFWDNICVNEALQFCPVCGGSIPAPVIPAASPTGLVVLAAGLLAAGTALLLWRRKRAG